MARPPRNDRKVKWNDATNRWEAAVTFPDGKIRRVRVTGKANKATAQEKLDDLLETRLLEGKAPEAQTRLYTFAEVIKAWLEAGIPNGGIPSANNAMTRFKTVKDGNTYDQTESNMRNHILCEGGLGSLYVDRTKRLAIEKAFIKIDQKRRLNARKDAPYDEARLASATVYRIWWHLANAVNWALREGMVRTNPVLEAKLPPERKSTNVRRSFQRDDLKRLWNHAAADKRAAIWMLTLMTGLRPGELIGLRWEWLDIDSKQPGLWVEEQAHHRGHRYIGQKAPKAGSKRAFELHKRVLPTLHRHRADLMAMGVYDPDGFVFPTSSGRSHSYSNLRKYLNEMLKDLDLGNEWTTYDMRHSFVSLTYDEVKDLQMIADLVGHEDVKTTLGYRHTVRTLNPDGAKIWDSIMGEWQEESDVTIPAISNPKVLETMPFKDASKRLQIKTQYEAYKMQRDGTFPVEVFKINGKLRVRISDVNEYLTTQKSA